jgi:hypothetical protein
LSKYIVHFLIGVIELSNPVRPILWSCGMNI